MSDEDEASIFRAVVEFRDYGFRGASETLARDGYRIISLINKEEQ